MNHSLKLKLKRVDGALIRVLGVTERRGWSTQAVLAQAMNDDGLALDLDVHGLRPVDLLVRQLARLPDVYAVEVAS